MAFPVSISNTLRFKMPLILALVVPAAASAAEPTPFKWTGFYAGFSAGVALNDTKFTENYYDTSEQGTKAGATLGLLAGYNLQVGGFVFGLEGDASALTGKNNEIWTAVPSQEMNNKANISHLVTLRPRIGYAFGNVLPYVTGGVAWGRIATSSGWTGYDSYWSTDNHEWRAAFVYGGGIEYAFDPKMTARFEVLHADFGNTTHIDSYGYAYGFDTRLTTVRAALAYKF